jgi:hypothetical protein
VDYARYLEDSYAHHYWSGDYQHYGGYGHYQPEHHSGAYADQYGYSYGHHANEV